MFHMYFSWSLFHSCLSFKLGRDLGLGPQILIVEIQTINKQGLFLLSLRESSFGAKPHWAKDMIEIQA